MSEHFIQEYGVVPSSIANARTRLVWLLVLIEFVHRLLVFVILRLSQPS